MSRRALAFVIHIALAVAQGGCVATPAVYERWAANDRVRAIAFAADPSGPARVTIHWRVRSTHARYRKGRVKAALSQAECAEVRVLLDGVPLPPSSDEQWLSVHLDPPPTVLHTRPYEPSAEPCTIELRLVPWSGEADPQVTLVNRRQTLGLFEAAPVRRTAWLAVFPPAVLADTALVIVAISTISIPPSITWTPVAEPDVHDP